MLSVHRNRLALAVAAAMAASAFVPSAALAQDAAPASREATTLDAVQVTGSRARGRAAEDTAAPVDVIGKEELNATGATEIGQILQMLEPSFNFSRTFVSDGTDILRPAIDVDTSCEILGGRSSMPFGIAPTGFTRLMQTEGEVAGVRAAEHAGVPFTLSTMGTRSVEDVAAAAAWCYAHDVVIVPRGDEEPLIVTMQTVSEAGTWQADGLDFVWTAGRASALDTTRIAEGRDVGTVLVTREGSDVPYDVTFAFVAHAFHPGVTIVGQ